MPELIDWFLWVLSFNCFIISARNGVWDIGWHHTNILSKLLPQSKSMQLEKLKMLSIAWYWNIAESEKRIQAKNGKWCNAYRSLVKNIDNSLHINHESRTEIYRYIVTWMYMCEQGSKILATPFYNFTISKKLGVFFWFWSFSTIFHNTLFSLPAMSMTFDLDWLSWQLTLQIIKLTGSRSTATRVKVCRSNINFQKFTVL